MGELSLMTEGGKLARTKMKEGDLVGYGRRSSQGLNSALPMKVRRMLGDEVSTWTGLASRLSGDKAWVFKQCPEK